MTLITTNKDNIIDNSGSIPSFNKILTDTSIKVGTKAKLIVEILPNFGNNNEVLKVSLIIIFFMILCTFIFFKKKVTWYRNDQKITDNQQRFKYGTDGKFHYLDINEVHVEDEGKWICMVENFHGRNSTTAFIKVLGKLSYI